MNWWQRLRKFFRAPEIRTLQVDFEMEERKDGRHHVRILKSKGDQRVPVEDFFTFCRYGYTEKTQVEDREVIFRLAEDDVLTLLALKSMNPEVQADGSLIFEVLPPQLEYLRTKGNVEEGVRSQSISVSKEEAEPELDVTFDPDSGLEVKAGYRDTEGRLLPESTLRKTPDGKYARLANRFIRLPTKLSDKARRLLDKGSFHVPLNKIPEFFLRDLVLLQEEFQAVLRDGAEDIAVQEQVPPPTVKMDLDTPGWLEFEVEYDIHGLKYPHSALPRKSTTDFYRMERHVWAKIAPEDRAAVDQKIQEMGATPNSSGGFRIPASQFASLEEFVDSIGGRKEATSAYEAYLEQLTDFQSDPKFTLPSVIEDKLSANAIRLRPYQRAGIHWLDWLCQNQLHGVLADDMGLGKTIQSICVLRLAYERSESRQHSLVVAPRSVLPHWEREIQRCFPKMRVYRYHGPGRRSMRLYADDPTVFITTYSTAANDKHVLSKIPFFYIILDEATYIKNPNTKRSQAIKEFNAVHRLALSGTPVENRPAEIWSIFDFLMRGHLGRHGTFVRTFEKPILANDSEASRRLGKRIKPFVLRRLKENVAQDLPEKIEIKEWCELAKEQRQLYGSLQDELEWIRRRLQRGDTLNYTTNVLPVLTKLKQICDHPAIVTEKRSPLHGRSRKFDWIIDKVVEIHGQGEKVVIFSQFLGMLNLLEGALQKRSIDYVRLDGSTGGRQRIIDQYNDTAITAALCSLRATSFGINLQSANHVIHADRWWNPAVEDQATDRVHRIGQKSIVYVYRIINEGTLEERIDRLLLAKRGMADRILEATDQKRRSWTREELIDILKPLDT